MLDANDHSRLFDKIGEGIKRGIDLAVGKDLTSIKSFVDAQVKLHPKLRDRPDILADRIITKKVWYASGVSFCYGMGGWFTLVPNLVHVWRIHGRLVLTVAYVYGYDLDDPERREEIALCFALSGSSESIKKLLQELGLQGAKKALLTPAMKAVIKSLPKQIITIAGQKSLLNIGKVVPVVGAVCGSIVDFFSTKGIGRAAKYYYS